MGNPGWPGKTRLGNAACCLLLLETLVSQEKSCRLLLLSYSCWWGILVGEKKTRLGNDAFHCLLLLGTVVSQKNCCRMLPRVCSCWWGILVGQEELGWWMPLVACCCWEPWLARKPSADCCCWFIASRGNPGWPGKTRLGNAACCLLLLGTLVSQEKSCRLLLLSYSCWWGILVGEKKTRLGNDAFHCLLLLGTVVSQKNCCRMLLRVCSCWWGILVGQEKLGWWMPLVACCCWEPSLARKTSADCCCWFIATGGESWLASKN